MVRFDDLNLKRPELSRHVIDFCGGSDPRNALPISEVLSRVFRRTGFAVVSVLPNCAGLFRPDSPSGQFSFFRDARLARWQRSFGPVKSLNRETPPHEPFARAWQPQS
jgi:hypothetical protein